MKSYFPDRKKLDRLAANQSESFARIPESKKINCVSKLLTKSKSNLNSCITKCLGKRALMKQSKRPHVH